MLRVPVDSELQQAFGRIEEHLTLLQGNVMQLQANVTQLRGDVTQLEERLNVHIEATETRLLTAFHNWAQT